MIETVTVDCTKLLEDGGRVGAKRYVVRKWILEIEPEEEYFSGVNDE